MFNFIQRLKARLGNKASVDVATEPDRATSQTDHRTPSQVQRNLAWIPVFEAPIPLNLPPPACPLLGPATGQLGSRYTAYIAQVEHLDAPVANDALREAGQALAQDLLTKAIDLGSSKAHEYSEEIYWLVQSAALAALFAHGPCSDEFATYVQHVHAFKDGPRTTAQVWAFDVYVAAHSPDARKTIDPSSSRFRDEVCDYPEPERADVEQLLRFRALLYPGGIAIKTYEVREGTYWPDYHAVVMQFYEQAGKDCWTDVHYLRHGGDAMLKNPSCIAQADLAQLKSLLTYCVRGERFCDGHWGAMIEQGHVLGLLDRLAVLHGQA